MTHILRVRECVPKWLEMDQITCLNNGGEKNRRIYHVTFVYVNPEFKKVSQMFKPTNKNLHCYSELLNICLNHVIKQQNK